MRRNQREAPEGTPDRLAEPVDHENPPRLKFAVVGIGASAGGLEAFSELLAVLPEDTGLAYVFIQHLPPDRESLLAEILAKRTRIPVLTVTDGMKVRPDHVYVIRPGYTVTLRGGLLRLGEPLERPGHRRPVDDFFRSLAEEQRERAICLVLSGMGSNGTSGAQVVKAAGGLCIAQDPDSARFPSMPRALIEHGYADYVLRPAEVPNALARYAAHPYAKGGGHPSPAPEDRQHIREILAIVRARTRRDFSGYKQPTLLRRIQRRMGLRQLDSVADYARVLRQNPHEVEALADDIMIHVSGFFRDPEAWDALRRRVIEPLVASRDDGSSIRAWVSACSSGEEAYTLAMVLTEVIQSSGKSFDVKIFATDTADRTLSQARAGRYPAGIEAEVSADRLHRFFDHEDADYRIKKDLRQLLVFAPQNVLQDSPFSRLDICSCRNLLIYLEPVVQRRLLGLLHFGLREGGALFLGTSETVVGSDDLFEPIDKKWRIFRRVGPARRAVLAIGGASDPPPAANGETPQAGAGQVPIGHLADAVLLERYTPPSVVIDRDHQIVYYHGSTDSFLVHPPGEPTRDLLRLAREPLRGALRTALHKAITQNAPVEVRDGVLEVEGVRRRLTLCVDPLAREPEAALYLVAFQTLDEPPPPPPEKSDEADPARMELEDELRRAKDELQSAIEELQTSNEEMKASNEEVTSINEELQSANEELETSKEELQSINEELTTVNAQLHAKMEELEATGNDLASLLSSTDIAVVFLDTRFRIRRFTPAVRDLLDLIPADVSRPLSDLARKFDDPTLLTDAQAVLDRLVPLEREIASDSGRTYIRRALPYRTADNRIDGVVLTFVDVTERARALRALRVAEERLGRVVEASSIGWWEVDIETHAIFSSARVREILGLPATGNLTPTSVLDALHPADAEAATARARDLLSTRGEATFSEQLRLRDGRTWIEVSGRFSRSDDPVALRGTITDITARKNIELAESETRDAAETAIRAKNHLIASVSHELRTPAAAILMWARILRRSKRPGPEQLAKGLDAIMASAESQRQLVEDLLDTARIASGHLPLRLENIDVGALVRACADAFRPAASTAGVTLTVRVGAGTGEITADPGRVSQILWNLIGNALKFTPRGGRIRMAASRRGHEVAIVVADSGRGIAAEDLSTIFDRFGSASGPSRDGSGMGLGLSIARDLAGLHGGTLEAESDGVGRGARFSLRLPVAPNS